MDDWSRTYPRVYEAFSPDYRSLTQVEAEDVVASVFGPGTSLEMAEGFFDDVGRALGGVGKSVGSVASQAAPYLAKAAPGALTGATAGAALGPWGMLAGGLAGGLSSALSGGKPGAPPPRPAPAMAPPRGAAQQSPRQLVQAFAAPGGSSGAAGQFLSALGSPTVQSALMSMLMGHAGNTTAPSAGGQRVPVAAVTNLLGMLASRASAEWVASSPYMGEDYLESLGDADLDRADPNTRYGWLYSQLLPPSDEADAGAARYVEAEDEAWLDDMYDELEAGFYPA